MKIAVAGGTGAVGRHVVQHAEARGHTVVVLARSRGVDVRTGAGLDVALAGVDAVVDVTSVPTRSARESRDFFRATTTNLLRSGVPHVVALSIVGIDRAPYDYYAGKVVQEELLAAGDVPWTVLRATQFHEFAQQVVDSLGFGPLHLAPVMRSQPVAAHEVGARLVDLAEAGPAGRVRDLAGPEVLRMQDLVAACARASGHRGPVLPVPLPGRFGKAMRDGSLLAGPDADLGTQTFTTWLDCR